MQTAYICRLVLNILAILAAMFVAVHLTRHLKTFKVLDLRKGDFNCSWFYLNEELDPTDEDFASAFRENYVLEPPERSSKNNNIDFTSFPWVKLQDWGYIQLQLLQMFANEAPGFFVEVGALDGEFLSQTLLLETKLNWTGLLVEPDSRSFADLRRRGRNAWLTPACVHHLGYGMHSFWRRNIPDQMPEVFVQLLRGISVLGSETTLEEEERGFYSYVPCTSLTTMLTSLGRREVDILTINVDDKSAERIQDIILDQRVKAKILLMYFDFRNLASDSFPSLRNYLLDVNRSGSVVKLLFNKSICRYSNVQESCQPIPGGKVPSRPCYVYRCLGRVNVSSVEVPSDAEK